MSCSSSEVVVLLLGCCFGWHVAKELFHAVPTVLVHAPGKRTIRSSIGAKARPSPPFVCSFA